MSENPPPFVIENREQLLGLLAEAAEIEHNLMCCYLYAAFSLKQSVDEGVSEAELAAIQRWRGPLVIRGNLELCAGTGRTIDRVTSTRLCRCGGSNAASQPSCASESRRRRALEALAGSSSGPIPASSTRTASTRAAATCSSPAHGSSSISATAASITF